MLDGQGNAVEIEQDCFPAYQLRIDISYAKPPIWRRVLVPANITFYDLHLLIQDLFDWDNDHLHEFNVEPYGESFFGSFNRTHIGMKVDPLGDPVAYADEVLDERKEILFKWLNAEGAKIEYIFDFGANWSHTIKLEKILEPEDDTTYPKLIKTKGVSPAIEEDY